MAITPSEFFETLETRVDASRTAGMKTSFRFDIDGAGVWRVDVDDGRVHVAKTLDGAEIADCTIATSPETFAKIVNGEQHPLLAYMSGKLKVKGDIAAAMKLQSLF